MVDRAKDHHTLHEQAGKGCQRARKPYLGAGADRGQSADDPLNPYLTPRTLSPGEIESREASLITDWLRVHGVELTQQEQDAGAIMIEALRRLAGT